MKKILGLVLGFFILFSYISFGFISVSASSKEVDVSLRIVEDEKDIFIGQKNIGSFEINELEGALASLSGGNNLIFLISFGGLIFLIILIILIGMKIKRRKKNESKKLKKKNRKKKKKKKKKKKSNGSI